MVHIETTTLGRVFQSLFVNLRTKAYDKYDHTEIADFCDGAEYLGGLVASADDKTDTFTRCLRSMAERHHCNEAIRIIESSSDES